ncbi:MAG TPA: glycosyltransferase [Polyangiaceae bacterium]|nr:glycosyltransferase [Polyangiaceae bacterium]
MKLLDVAEFFSERGGGVRSYLEELLRQGERRGHPVVVVAPGPRDEEKRLPGGSALVRVRGPAMPYDPTYHALVRLGRVREIVRREAPDVVQASAPYVAAGLVAALRGVPLRAHVYHSDQITTYAAPLAARLRPRPLARSAVNALFAWPRALSRRFDLTLAPSAFIARQLSDQGCVRVRQVTFGIRHEQFGPERRNESMRRDLLGPFADTPGAALVVAACRLAVEKRVGRTIEAVHELNRRRPVALAILGEGPERRRLERLAEGLPAVRFLGFLRDRAEYAALLAGADVFVHGGYAETFCFVLGEALSSGTPIVVPASGAALDFAELGVGASFSAEAPSAEVAAAIERVLERPREPERARALEASRRVPSTDEHFDRLFALYEEGLAAKRRAPGVRHPG